MMNIKRRKTPRDWFKHEESKRGHGVPIQQSSAANNLPALYSAYFTPLSNFFLDMERMFTDTFDTMREFQNFGLPSMASPSLLGMQNIFQPNVNITSNDNEYAVTVEVPGIEEKDVRIDVSDDGLLTISGEKRQESSEERGNIQYAEFNYGAFERTLSLPEDVKREAIQARFKNGLLTIRCPRTETARTGSRQIPINTTSKIESARTGSASERLAEQNPKKAA